MLRVCVKVLLANIALAAIFYSSLSVAEMRDRVSITADNNVVSDTGQPLRGAPFFLDLFSIFETQTNGNVVGGMQANEALYRQYFSEMVTEYNINTVRIAPWLGVWETMQVEDQYYDSHKSEFVYMVDTVVDWAEEEGIYAIVNLHTRFGTDADLQRMKDFWDVFAPRYKDKTHVIYELTNEPKTQFWTEDNIVQRRININDPDLIEDYDSNTLIQTSMAPLYQHVRAIAPDTHLILWSPNNPSSLPLQDIIDSSTGIDYSNASVGFHIYEFTLDKKSQWDIADTYRDNFPTMLTEFYSLTHADNYPIDYAHLITNLKTAEERGYSWVQWGPTANYANLNQKITHNEIKFSDLYKDLIQSDMYAVFDSNGNDIRNAQGTTIIVDANGVDANGNIIAQGSDSVVRVNEAKAYWSADHGGGSSGSPTPLPTQEPSPTPTQVPSPNPSPSTYSDDLVSVAAPEVFQLEESNTVSVAYSASTDLEIVVIMADGDDSWSWQAFERVAVGAGEDTINVSFSLNANANAGDNYKLQVLLVPQGGNLGDAIDEISSIGHIVANVPAAIVYENTLAFAPAPNTIDLSGNISVAIDYETDQARDLVVEIFDPSWNWLGWAIQAVETGVGSQTLSLNVGEIDAGDYQLKLSLRERGGDWTTSVLDIYHTVQAEQVVEQFSGFYRLANIGSNGWIRPVGGSFESGVHRVTSEYTGNWTRWSIIDAGDGYYHLLNKATNKYVRPVNEDHQSPMIMVSTDQVDHWTQFAVEALSDGVYRLINRQTGKFFRPGSKKLNSPVSQVDNSYTGSWTKWNLLPAN